ncbi:MAG: FAD-dependent oxidoreductase [Rhodospirillaceae bacterium]
MKSPKSSDRSFSTTVSKRSFLSAAGAVAVGLGIGSKAIAADESEKYDLVVVGGGNAGMPAAIFAAARGGRVLIIEAAAQLGGTLFLSGGQMSAAGTKLQKAQGLKDSPAEHYNDIMRISKNKANPEIVRLAVYNAADTFDWLHDNGLEVHPEHPVTGTTHEPYSRPRYAWGLEGGISILKILEKLIQPHIDSGAITVRTSTEVIELIQEPNGAVNGVVARAENGKTTRYSGRNILLSCGGYASNPEMVEELEKHTDYGDVSYPYSQGAGITLATAAGGYVRGGEHHLPSFGSILQDDNFPSPRLARWTSYPPHRQPWEIYVNVNGERFLREDMVSHDVREHALVRQPEERCWIVFDEAILDQAPPGVSGWTRQEIRDAFESQDMFIKANSVEALAEACGVNKDSLIKTVARYNQGQDGGKDALGRDHMPLPIGKAPFYAIRVQGSQLIGWAGLAVDGQLRVIRQDGSAIPNLYAAGELLGTDQFMGRSYCGGMLVTPALTFGRLLGGSMLEFEI